MAWKDLSIAQRSQLMNIMRHNGISSLSEMRRLYDLSSLSSSSLEENTFSMRPQAPVYDGGGEKTPYNGEIRQGKKWNFIDRYLANNPQTAHGLRKAGTLLSDTARLIPGINIRDVEINPRKVSDYGDTINALNKEGDADNTMNRISGGTSLLGAVARTAKPIVDELGKDFPNWKWTPRITNLTNDIINVDRLINMGQFIDDFATPVNQFERGGFTDLPNAVNSVFKTTHANKHGNGGSLFENGGPEKFQYPFAVPDYSTRLWLLKNAPEIYGGSIEPSVITASLPAKFNGSQEVARRYAEGYQRGAKPMTNAVDKAGQKIFKTVDTIAGFTPAGGVTWLGHMGADIANGEYGKVGRDVALAAATGLGFRALGKGVSYLRNYWNDIGNFGEDTFRAFTDRPIGKVGELSDKFRYENIPWNYTGYSGYTPTTQSKAGAQFVEDVTEAAEWGRFRGKPEAPKTKMYDFSEMEPIGGQYENTIYIDPDDPGQVLRVPKTILGQPTVERAINDAVAIQKELDNIYNARMNIAGFTKTEYGDIVPVFSQKRMVTLPDTANSVEEGEALKEAVDRFARSIGENPVYKWNYSHPVNNIFLENDNILHGRKDFKPDNIGFTDNGFLMGFDLHKNGGKIHIKPQNRGKFTALKKRTGKSASWFKAHGTPAQKKMAIFALNSRHWRKKAHGGVKF